MPGTPHHTTPLSWRCTYVPPDAAMHARHAVLLSLNRNCEIHAVRCFTGGLTVARNGRSPFSFPPSLPCSCSHLDPQLERILQRHHVLGEGGLLSNKGVDRAHLADGLTGDGTGRGGGGIFRATSERKGEDWGGQTEALAWLLPASSDVNNRASNTCGKTYSRGMCSLLHSRSLTHPRNPQSPPILFPSPCPHFPPPPRMHHALSSLHVSLAARPWQALLCSLHHVL